MDSGLKFTLLVLGVWIYCCSTPGQTQEIISRVGDRLDDYRISGSIYVLHVREIPDSLTDLLLDHIETYGHVIVKFAGNPISIVRDADALHHLLRESVHHSKNVSISQDLLNVAYISERNSHLLLVVDEHEAEMTVDTDMALAFLRGSTIRVDVIRLPVTSGGRQRRQSSVNFYQLLANVSGGSVITTDKNNIGSAVNIITQSLQSNRVNLMRLSYSGAPGTSFMVFVDDTITQLIVRVQAERAQPVVIAMTPSGTPSSARPTSIGSVSAGSVVALLEINITQADYGIWKIMKMDSNLWDVTIQAISPVDFTHKFVEPGPGGFGEYEIKGRPISGVLYKMVVEVPEYAKLSKVQSVLLMIRDSQSPKGFGVLQNVGGRRGQSIFTANITIPVEPFMVAIQGSDNSSPTKHTFKRLDPNLITPVTLRLFIPPLTGVILWANETLDIPFTVQNAGADEQGIDVRIEDDQHFALDPNIHSYNIKAGMNESGTFTIKGGPKGGVTTTVTINAKPFVMGSMTFQSGQFDIRRFTVTEHEDHINPTCNITLTTGPCNIGPDPCACVNFTWSAEMNVGDEGFGLKKVYLDPASSTFKFTVDSFQQGHNISMGVIKAKLGSDCCLQNATIRVEDLAGNTDECDINITQGWVPPDLQACFTTTTTTQSTTTPMSTTTTPSSSSSSSSVSTSTLSTLSLQSTVSTIATASRSPGASTASTAGGTLSATGTSKSSSGTQSPSSASQTGATQAPAGTPNAGSTQSSSGASTGINTLAGPVATSGTQLAPATQQSGATQATSGTQLASGSPQSGATQAPSGTPTSGATQTAAATNNESKSSDSNNGLTAVSIGAGMGVGAIIGVTALAAMACLFKKAMSKNTKSVAPQEQGGRRDDEERRERERIQRNLAWT
ncbi:uncharacterized protein LOC127860220 isoform X1 [Dreissena polymorpha]|uniref:uncharacterized protein LOC127860220 isoform X1 n=1 Tax=Dreissena polymorpha TaxID=45954 RepID=UPI002263AF8D|nr:uncharacterized protein LOC127860220 isoform X1 [Dreissena polymorpha]